MYLYIVIKDKKEYRNYKVIKDKENIELAIDESVEIISYKNFISKY